MTAMSTITDEIQVMTSGAFTAAYLELLPRLERLTKKKLITAATSIGTGENSIPNRLRRGEPVDVVIVADSVLLGFINDGLIMAESYTPVARSAIGIAVRAGAPKPDISTIDALRHTLLQAKSIAYSASVSGDYVSTELLQRLGITDQVISKSRRIEGGERVGAVIARGEAEIGFQQMSELLPVPGIDHVTPLPPAVQKVSVFSAGVALSSRDADAAHALIKFLASPEAAGAITKSGLEPIGSR
jgi:molybdate transport system substrate-binding protein